MEDAVRGVLARAAVAADAALRRYPGYMIDGPDNLVRIPKLKHQEITAWFRTGNERFGGKSPREYLRGATWDDRRRIGFQALIDFGVLQP
jgi:hypothetical protein